MKLTKAFPGKYLKAADLDGREVSVAIDYVELEPMPQTGDENLVAYFVGKRRGLVLNKTNATTIEAAYGGETDDWSGKRIALYPTTTEFGEKTVDCIRVKTPTADEPTDAETEGDDCPF